MTSPECRDSVEVLPASPWWCRFLRVLFFALLVRPVILLALGLAVRHRQRLPVSGPMVVVANHNSHLDTMVLMSLFPLRVLPQLRPVAAADYFLRNRFLAWFSYHIIGIIPLTRGRSAKGEDPLAACHQALNQGAILILFPEGSRGEPEKMVEFKNGVAHLVRQHPAVPVLPVFMRGLGRVLPKGEWLLVPHFIDVVVGFARSWDEVCGEANHKHFFVQSLRSSIDTLASELPPSGSLFEMDQ